MNIEGQKVLVTGADGFIGSHLVENLVKRGAQVKAFVYYNSFNNWGWLDTVDKSIMDQVEVFAGDIRDPFGVKEAMKGCETVFHLAALIAIPFSYHSPATYVDTNVIGTLNVVQAAKELGTRKVVHTSTSEVYGTAMYVPIDEKHPIRGQSPYSASKIGADQMAMSYFRSFDTPVAIIRPFNTFGPRQSARAVIPTIIGQVLSGVTEIKLGDLTPTRDFSFVADTAEGFVAIAESEKTIGEVTNIGSGFEISIGDTVKLIAEVAGKSVSVISDQDRLRPEKSEVFRLFAGIEKAKELTAFNGDYSGNEGFKKGLKETIDWFSDQSNLSKYKTDIYNI